MIRKLKSGEYRLYSRKVNPKTGRRRNLGTFRSRLAAEKARARGAVFQAALTRCSDDIRAGFRRAQRPCQLAFRYAAPRSGIVTFACSARLAMSNFSEGSLP